MLFMPFQVLWILLRGLLALVLVAAGVVLLGLWYANRSWDVVEERLVTPPEVGTPDVPRDTEEPRTEPYVRREYWQFGWNWPTAYFVGGLALLGYSFTGMLVAPALWRRRGADEPKDEQPGEARTIRRPDGTELHAELHGPADAPCVVLTHGWGLDNREWYYAKKQLGGRFRVITWDLPGLGQSSRPGDNNWSLERMARDLEAVLALAGDRPAVLVGHSIGGMITLTFCRLFPEALGRRVAGLVLAQTTYTNPVKTTQMAEFYRAIQKPVLEPMCHLMIGLAPLVWLMNWQSYLNGSAHRDTERGCFSGHETRGQLNFLSKYYVRAWPGVVARGFLAMFRYDASDVLGAITVPTLVVTGDGDTVCKPEASEVMSKAIPGAKLLTLRPARHAGLFEHHEEFGRAVGQFAAECLQRQQVAASGR